METTFAENLPAIIHTLTGLIGVLIVLLLPICLTTIICVRTLAKRDKGAGVREEEERMLRLNLHRLQGLEERIENIESILVNIERRA